MRARKAETRGKHDNHKRDNKQEETLSYLDGAYFSMVYSERQ